MLKVMDATTLEKLGMDNDVARTHVAEVINTCTILLGQDRNNSLMIFGRSLKRKVEEVDLMLEDNQRLIVESQRNDEEYQELTKEKEKLTHENEALKTQADMYNATMKRLTEEARDLRTIQKKAGTTTAELHSKITAAAKEKYDLDEAWQSKFAVFKQERSKLKHENEKILQKLSKSNATLEQKATSIKTLQAESALAKESFNKALDERESIMLGLSENAHESKTQLEEKSKELLSCQADLELTRNELNAKKAELEAMVAANEEFTRTTRSAIHEEYNGIINSMNETICRVQSMPTFSDKVTGFSSMCPIPTKTGCIDSLRNIMVQWKTMPCDNEGELHASFRCPLTGFTTSIASSEQMHLVRSIAFDAGLIIKPPFYIEYFDATREVWEEFLFSEQVTMISKVCKIFRRKITDCTTDHLVVANGKILLTFHMQQTGEELWALGFNLKSLVSVNVAFPIRMIVTDPFQFEGLEFAHLTDQPALDSSTRNIT